MGLREEIEELKKQVSENKLKDVEEKPFKYPFGKKVGKGQKKKNFVTVIIVQENNTVDFKKYKIEDQTIMHDLIPRLATAGHVMMDKKGNPLVILPSWSVEPFSPLQHFSDSLENGSNVKGYKILLAKMLKEGITSKKSTGGLLPWIIGLAILGLIGYAFLSGGGTPATPK